MVRHCLWKMCPIHGGCIKPGLVRLPLCHKVNLLSYVAPQPLSRHRVNLPCCVARRPLCQVHLQRKKAKNITNIYAVQLSTAYIPAVYIWYSDSGTFSASRFSGALDVNFITAK